MEHYTIFKGKDDLTMIFQINLNFLKNIKNFIDVFFCTYRLIMF